MLAKNDQIYNIVQMKQYPLTNKKELSDGTIYDTDFGGRKPQATHFSACHQERHTELQQECFRQTIEQHEADSQDNTRLLEISSEGTTEFTEDGLGTSLFFT